MLNRGLCIPTNRNVEGAASVANPGFYQSDNPYLQNADGLEPVPRYEPVKMCILLWSRR